MHNINTININREYFVVEIFLDSLAYVKIKPNGIINSNVVCTVLFIRKIFTM